MTVTATTSCFTPDAAGLGACVAARRRRRSPINVEPEVTMNGERLNYADLLKPSKV